MLKQIGHEPGAVEFARAEDTWGFLADGSGTYESVKGIVQIARDLGKTAQLAATKTKPSDATLDDFRALRRVVNKAALNGRLSAYYIDSTWETRLPAFRTDAEPNVYQRLPDGSAVLDGYPVIWTDVLEPYGTDDAALVERCGGRIKIIRGSYRNIKITTPEDIFIAEALLKIRKPGPGL